VLLMALTLKQKERLNRQIGVLEGMSWVWVFEEKYQPMAEALETVIEQLEKVLDEDGGAEG
jgi:hypothetical protein